MFFLEVSFTYVAEFGFQANSEQHFGWMRIAGATDWSWKPSVSKPDASTMEAFGILHYATWTGYIATQSPSIESIYTGSG